MKRWILLALLLTLVSWPDTPPAQLLAAWPTPAPSADGTRLQGELVVQLVAGADWRLARQVGLDHHLEVHYASPPAVAWGLLVARVDESQLEATMARLERDPRVSSVSPNTLYTALANEDPFPNDPRYQEQWHMQAIDVEKAWQTTRGKGAVVAVVDTGVAYRDWKKFRQVEDLKQTSFTVGYDFVNRRPEALDDNGHGTHVAGTVAQSTHNGVGVAGVAFEATVMPIKVLNARGSGSLADVASGIRLAADQGANVVTLCLGARGRDRVLHEACAYARGKGCTLVAAAGNTGGRSINYPAAFDECLAIAASDQEGNLASYSARAPGVDLTGPGGDQRRHGTSGGILQNTLPRDGQNYLFYSGTSMATAHAGGVAALVVACGVTEPEQVEKVLRTSARGVDDPDCGAGLLDAGRAVAAAQQQVRLPLWLGWVSCLGLFIYQRRRSRG
ncbi:MAG: peptidase S8 [Candidatus Eremiobacteraeota bacterium]|nr:peptidase S8 [Candidatus Eremiobacteraeota bacterium]